MVTIPIVPVDNPAPPASCSSTGGPCHGCAFTEGSEANLEPWNRIRAMISARAGTVFYCHEGMDWRDPLAHAPKTRREWRAMMLKPCQGWRREVRKLAAAGHFRDPIRRGYFHALGNEALTVLEEWKAHRPGKAKKRLWRKLEEMLDRLFDDRGRSAKERAHG